MAVARAWVSGDDPRIDLPGPGAGDFGAAGCGVARLAFARRGAARRGADPGRRRARSDIVWTPGAGAIPTAVQPDDADTTLGGGVDRRPSVRVHHRAASRAAG